VAAELVLITTDISFVFLELRSPFRRRAVLVQCSTSLGEIISVGLLIGGELPRL
jgi:hypothetical protein